MHPPARFATAGGAESLCKTNLHTVELGGSPWRSLVEMSGFEGVVQILPL